MNLAIYLMLAMLAGATWGTSLGFLLNAPRKQASEMKQWLAFAAAMLVVVGCAVFMKTAGELGQLTVGLKASAGAVFLVSFGLAFRRCRVRL